MNVMRLDGELLDFWVAKSEGLELLPYTPDDGEIYGPHNGFWHPSFYRPSSNWVQGGPIVSNEWYELETVLNGWFGPNWAFVKAVTDNPLKWMMRAYVSVKFGDEVEDIEGVHSPLPSPVTAPDYRPPAGVRRWSAWFGRSQAGHAD